MTFNVSSVSLQWNGKLCEGNYKAAVALIWSLISVPRSVDDGWRLLKELSGCLPSHIQSDQHATHIGDQRSTESFCSRKLSSRKFLSCNIQLTQHATHVGYKLFIESFCFRRLCRQKDVKWPRLWLLLGKDKRFSYLGKTGKLYLGKDRDWPWRWLSRPTGLPGVKPHHTQDITEMAFWDAFKLQHSDRHFTAVTHLDLLNTV